MPTEVKFIYSEKATNFCEISTVDLSYVGMVKSTVKIFAKCCGLLRIYEFYLGGHNLAPLIEIGLTYLPKIGGDPSPRPLTFRRLWPGQA